MKFASFLAAATLATAALVGAASSSKADVKYLVNATFDDTTKLTGDFFIDTYGYLTGFDLTTVGGTLSGYNYTPTTTFLSGCGTNCLFFGVTVPAYDGGLQLTFAKPLGSYGPDAIIGGSGGPSWENESFSSGGPPIRFIAEGAATGVPELSTWMMMLLGFAALRYGGYRRANDRFANGVEA